MNRALPILARWLHSVCLALWLGGLIAIGALVAPTAFHVVRINPALAGNTALQTTLAGGIVGGSLRLFVVLCYACGALLLVSDFLLVPSVSRRWTLACVALTAVLLATALYQGLSLTPAMDMAQQQGNLLVFDRLHHRYEQISVAVQFPLLLLLALCAALRDTRPAPAKVKRVG